MLYPSIFNSCIYLFMVSIDLSRYGYLYTGLSFLFAVPCSYLAFRYRFNTCRDYVWTLSSFLTGPVCSIALLVTPSCSFCVCYQLGTAQKQAGIVSMLPSDNSVFHNWMPHCDIKPSDPKSTINEHFGVLPTGTYHSRNYVLKKCQVSGFTKEHRAAKLHSACQLMDVQLSLILLNALAALIPSRSVPCLFLFHSQKSLL
jgi:hypothetical protein